MINYFIGKTQAELETYLRAAQDDLGAGRTVTAAGAGDSNVQERIEVDVWKRIEQILFALNALAPLTYPADQIKRVTRTRIQVYPWPGNLSWTVP